MTNPIVEFAAFTVKPGVSEALVLSASKAVQDEFMRQQPGCLKRELVAEGSGVYADFIWWATLEQAHSAMAKVFESPACLAYFDLMQLDQENLEAGIKHFRSLATF